MIVQKFNKNLEKYSHYLTKLRLLRNQLSLYSLQALFEYLASKDFQSKGYFTQLEIEQSWLQSHKDIEIIKEFMNFYFNFQRISFTIIHKFLKGHHESSLEVNTPKQSIETVVQSIFEISIHLHELRQAIMAKMQKFVPSKYSRPSVQELSKYVICQNLTVDIKEVSQSFNLLENNIQFEPIRENLDFDKTLANPSVSNLQDIMKRLQFRVSSFGKEWLIDEN